MTRAAIAVALVALASGLGVVACGEEVPDVGDLPAEPAPAPATAGAGATSEDPQVVRRLRRLRPGGAARGAVVVVDVTGRDLTSAPRQIEFAKDGTLSGLRWTGWGSDAAVGRGAVRLLECNPSCARGLPRKSVATIRLTRLKRCQGRRFYDAAEVTFGTGAERGHARAHIGAPC